MAKKCPGNRASDFPTEFMPKNIIIEFISDLQNPIKKFIHGKKYDLELQK